MKDYKELTVSEYIWEMRYKLAENVTQCVVPNERGHVTLTMEMLKQVVRLGVQEAVLKLQEIERLVELAELKKTARNN